MRILHVFRTPVGGLFRHVRDLARGQQAAGHDVGILCDSTTGGETATRLLASVETYCSLGVKRIPISRLPGFGDLSAARLTRTHAAAIGPHIIHCHGAKGGLYGRIAARRLGIVSVYTPHGGSLHYRWGSPAGAIFLSAERLLARIGSGLHFVCRFEHDSFDRLIGIGGKPNAVIHNGLWPEEFAGVAIEPDAADVLFIGDMRLLKGVDVLLRALALCKKERPVTACLVGDGPDLDRFKALNAELGLAGAVRFPGRLSATEAFRRGHLLVMPSLAESFPYVVLEAGAAGVPMIASNVGGIPEVLGADQLVPPGNAEALAARLTSCLDNPSGLASSAAAARDRIRQDFGAAQMVEGVLALYRLLLAG